MSDKPSLPDDAPDRDARLALLLAWANKALTREHNPIVRVRRYGLELDARLEMVMSNGDEVRVRVRELLGANGLRHVLLAYDGTVIPGYDQPSCSRIVSRLIWASEASVRDDETETLVDDLSGYLARTLHNGVVRGSYDEADGRRLVVDFVELNKRETAFLAVLAVNQATTPHTLWVPRGSLVGYLREGGGKVHQPDLRASLEKVGWRWENFQRRDPLESNRKPTARVYELDIDWERCPFDLETEVKEADSRGAGTAARQ